MVHFDDDFTVFATPGWRAATASTAISVHARQATWLSHPTRQPQAGLGDPALDSRGREFSHPSGADLRIQPHPAPGPSVMNSTFVIDERSGEDHVVALATNQVMKAGLTGCPVQRFQGPLVIPGTNK